VVIVDSFVVVESVFEADDFGVEIVANMVDFDLLVEISSNISPDYYYYCCILNFLCLLYSCV
jgi:hypothetical protein